MKKTRKSLSRAFSSCKSLVGKKSKSSASALADAAGAFPNSTRRIERTTDDGNYYDLDPDEASVAHSCRPPSKHPHERSPQCPSPRPPAAAKYQPGDRTPAPSSSTPSPPPHAAATPQRVDVNGAGDYVTPDNVVTPSSLADDSSGAREVEPDVSTLSRRIFVDAGIEVGPPPPVVVTPIHGDNDDGDGPYATMSSRIVANTEDDHGDAETGAFSDDDRRRVSLRAEEVLMKATDKGAAERRSHNHTNVHYDNEVDDSADASKDDGKEEVGSSSFGIMSPSASSSAAAELAPYADVGTWVGLRGAAESESAAVYVLLLCRERRVFEFVEVETNSDATTTNTIGDLLDVARSKSYDRRLADGPYVGLTRPSPMDVFVFFSLEMTAAAAAFGDGDVLVAVPEGCTGRRAAKIAGPIFRSPKFREMVRRYWHRPRRTAVPVAAKEDKKKGRKDDEGEEDKDHNRNEKKVDDFRREGKPPPDDAENYSLVCKKLKDLAMKLEKVNGEIQTEEGRERDNGERRMGGGSTESKTVFTIPEESTLSTAEPPSTLMKDERVCREREGGGERTVTTELAKSIKSVFGEMGDHVEIVNLDGGKGYDYDDADDGTFFSALASIHDLSRNGNDKNRKESSSESPKEGNIPTRMAALEKKIGVTRTKQRHERNKSDKLTLAETLFGSDGNDGGGLAAMIEAVAVKTEANFKMKTRNDGGEKTEESSSCDHPSIGGNDDYAAAAAGGGKAPFAGGEDKENAHAQKSRPKRVNSNAAKAGTDIGNVCTVVAERKKRRERKYQHDRRDDDDPVDFVARQIEAMAAEADALFERKREERVRGGMSQKPKPLDAVGKGGGFNVCGVGRADASRRSRSSREGLEISVRVRSESSSSGNNATAYGMHDRGGDDDHKHENGDGGAFEGECSGDAFSTTVPSPPTHTLSRPNSEQFTSKGASLTSSVVAAQYGDYEVHVLEYLGTTIVCMAYQVASNARSRLLARSGGNDAAAMAGTTAPETAQPNSQSAASFRMRDVIQSAIFLAFMVNGQRYIARVTRRRRDSSTDGF